MITSTVKQLPQSTLELEIIIPWKDISDAYAKFFARVAKNVEIKGFRKGKAPKKLVEQNIDKKKIYEEVIKEVVPKAYSKALTTHQLKPIASPKIELTKVKEYEDWTVKATIALKPKVNLGDYKQKIKNAKKGQTKIWTPGDQEKAKNEDKKPSVDQLINVLLDEVKVELSDLLVEQEKNKLLTNLIDQTQKLGLTIDQYIIAKGMTKEQLQAEYQRQAVKNLKVEFVLAEIADQENITVAQKDIDELITKVKDEKEREKLKQQSYYLAYLIRQQKTLDFLSNL